MVKKLLKGQTKLIGQNTLDARLEANFVCDVSLAGSSQPVKPELLAEIRQLSDQLRFANAQAVIRKTYIENGQPERVNAAFLAKMWGSVLGKEDKTGIVQAMTRGQDYPGGELLSYAELETALLASLVESSAVPVLSKAQRKAIEAAPETPSASASAQQPDAEAAAGAGGGDGHPHPHPHPQHADHASHGKSKTPVHSPAAHDHKQQQHQQQQSGQRKGSGSPRTARSSSSSSPPAQHHHQPLAPEAVAEQVAAMQQRITEGGVVVFDGASPIAADGAAAASSSSPSSPSSPRARSPSRSPTAGTASPSALAQTQNQTQAQAQAQGQAQGQGQGQLDEPAGPALLSRRHTVSSSKSVWTGPDITFTRSPSKFMPYRSCSPLPEPSRGAAAARSLSQSQSPGAEAGAAAAAAAPAPLSPAASRSKSPPPHLRPSEESKGQGPDGGAPAATAATKTGGGGSSSSSSKLAKRTPGGGGGKGHHHHHHAHAPSASDAHAMLDLSGLELAALSAASIPLPVAQPPLTLASIVVLNLSRNNLADFAAVELGGLRSLLELDCSRNKFRGPCPPHLFPPSLLKLDLSHNEVTDTAGLLTCVALKSLSVHHNSIRQFTGLPPALDSLDVSHNAISSVFTLRLLSLSSKITHLRVEGNPITAPAQQQSQDEGAGNATGTGKKDKGLEWRTVLNSVLPLLVEQRLLATLLPNLLLLRALLALQPLNIQH